MRARWLKPEFFTDKKVAAAGPIAALVYQALWCMADDGGTAPCDPDTIKAQMFYRWSAVGVPEITRAVQTLAELRRIDPYTVGDDAYARILRWSQHQQVHKPSKFRYPARPPVFTPISAALPPEPPGTPPEPPHASPPPRLLDSQTPKPSPVADATDAEFERAWSLYPKRAGGNSKSLARKAWRARVKSGVAPSDMIAGVERYAAFVRETGKERTEFVKQAATFFGPDAHWAEPWDAPAPVIGTPQRPEHWTEKKAREDSEASEFRRIQGLVQARRARGDGEEWWARMQRDAGSVNAREQYRFAANHLNEPGISPNV